MDRKELVSNKDLAGDVIDTQGELIILLCEGYRDCFRIVHRKHLSPQQKLDLIRERLDFHYPGRSGTLFKDSFGES